MENKILVSYDTSNNTYALKVKAGYGEKVYLNDNEIPSNTIVITKQLPYKIKTVKSNNVVDYYESENGNISLADYQSKVTELTQNAELYGVTYTFATLDDEYNYRKFTESYKPVLKQEFVWTEYEIQIEEKPVSEYPEIALYFCLDDIKIAEDTQGLYTPNPVTWFREFCIKKGLTETKDSIKNTKTFDIPTHSGIRFAKIGGNFICNDADSKFNSYQGSYKECVERLKKDKQKVLDIVNLGMLKAFPEPIDISTTKNVLDFISVVENLTKNLDVKKDSISTKRALLNKTEEYKNQFLEVLKNE